MREGRILTQVQKRQGIVERVKPGETPVLELRLEPGQYVANVDLKKRGFACTNRKTDDWDWTAYVVTPL